MSTPVCVIPGIGARDAESFARTAEALGTAAGFTAVPVFWGDLGARTAMLERTVPGLPDDEVRGDELAMSTEAERTLAEFLVSGKRGGAERGVETRGEEATVPDKVLDNLWEPLDLLAFIAARVFVLHDGSPPVDRPVPHLVSSGIWSHSAYWKLQDVAAAIAHALRPAE